MLQQQQQHLSIQNATRAATAWAASPIGRLVRVEVLVTLSCALLAALVFLSSSRRGSRSAALRLVVWLALMLSYPAVSYTTGLMQSGIFRNELVVVWACFLLGCADGIAACSIDASDQQARTMLNQAAQIVYVLFLLLSYYGSLQVQIKVILFLFWTLNVVKLSMRLVKSCFLEGSREHSLAVENRLVTRRGKTLVLTGDVDMEDGRRSGDGGDVDIDMVKGCNGELLSSDSWGSRNLKHLCMSFALFKQLLRRFTGCYPTGKRGSFRIPPDPWGGDVHETAYRVIEMELGFLFDFFYGRHPSLNQTLIPETLVFCSAVTLSLSALFSPSLLLNRVPEGGVLGAPPAVRTGFDIWLARLTIVLFVVVESFQYLTLLLSDWHKVSIACRYVRHPGWRTRPILERLLGFMCSITLTTRYWSNCVGQYSLLGACLRYQNSLVARVPFLPKRIRSILIRSIWMVVTHQDLPMPVKHAVYKVLPRVGKYSSPDSTGLPTEYTINHGTFAMGEWAWRRWGSGRGRGDWDQPLWKILEWSIYDQGVARSMLIWHIATTICDYKTPPQVGTDLEVEEDQNQLVATTISDYCCYLLFYATELMMENFHSTHLFLQELQVNAQQCLSGCRSKDAMFERLSLHEMGVDDKYKAILTDGTKFADQLLQELCDDKAALWELLAEVWVEKLLSFTPSNNLTAHTTKLATGGEYITHLWVFLTHNGILEPTDLFDRRFPGPHIVTKDLD